MTAGGLADGLVGRTGVPCRISVERLPTGGITVIVQGELDGWSGATLGTVLDHHGWSRTYIDLSAVTFIDAAGLRAVLAAYRRRPDQVRVVAPSSIVERLAQLAVHRHDVADGSTPVEALLRDGRRPRR